MPCSFFQWDAFNYSAELEPVDEVVQSPPTKYGKYDPVVEYLAKPKDHWLAIPGTDPTANLTCCARISMLKNFAGIDIQAMYPAEPGATPQAAQWTYDTFLKAAEACAKAGFPFAWGWAPPAIRSTPSARSFVRSAPNWSAPRGRSRLIPISMRSVLEYGQKLVRFFPSDTVSYDDASNNRALISGKSALIWKSALRLGGGETRCSGRRQGLLDIPLPGRAERALHSLRLHVLWHLEIQPEQDRGKGIDRASDATAANRRARRGVRGLQPAASDQHVGFQDLVRGPAAKGHDVQLSDPAMA